jgi:hypothetical protein
MFAFPSILIALLATKHRGTFKRAEALINTSLITFGKASASIKIRIQLP